uniref:TSA: Wollemia nobilis Ref_Wollemi_Transcript_9443_1549 transcribed RNA sequence n=1 Tax=Wollemia nobilis TaxID=56998 RepID=A0A0C9S789_9CONI
MALQAGVATSKILVLVGAGLTGSVLLRSGRLSDLISELQALMTKIDENGESSDSSETAAILAAQVRRLAQEVRQLASSRSITVVNGSGQSGSLASYLMPIVAFGAIGYGYMWWKGWSFSDVMFVTKRNMSNAVASMTKQLDQFSTALAATKRHLTQRIENLDGKMDEQKEISKLIKNEVVEVREDLSQIGFDIDAIQKMVAGLEGKIETLEDKQDFANAGVWYLCQFVGGTKDGRVPEVLQNFSAKAQLERAAPKFTEDKSIKGLQYIADTIQSGTVDKTKANAILENDIAHISSKNDSAKGPTKIHRSFATRVSLKRTISLNE